MTKTAPDKPAKKAPLASVMKPINFVVERWIPSSLVFAIVLTIIVALLALIVTPTSPIDLVVGWGDGLAGLLAFMTQMALILLLGHMLANTKPVRQAARLGRREAEHPDAGVPAGVRHRGRRVADHVGSRPRRRRAARQGGRPLGSRPRSQAALPDAGRRRVLGLRRVAHGLLGFGPADRGDA